MAFTSVDDILTEAKTRIGKLGKRVVDPTLAATDADDDVLTVYATSAFRKAAITTKRIKGRVMLPLLGGQSSYDLPADVYDIRRVQYESDEATVELVQADDLELAARLEGPNPEEGPPRAYAARTTQLMVYPRPTNAEGMDRVIAWYRSNGSFLSAGDSWTLIEPTAPESEGGFLVDVPQEIEDAIPDYVVGQWLIDVGEAQRGVQLTQYFESQMQELKIDPQSKNVTRRTPRFF